jgi:hypothetical protein
MKTAKIIGRAILDGKKEDEHMTLAILKIIAAVGTIVTGLVSLIWPRSVTGFTGLSPSGPRGVTEIRAVLGAFFVGLGVAPLILRKPATYQMLGITYLLVAVVRTVSMILDRSIERSNIISVVVEIIFGVILVL